MTPSVSAGFSRIGDGPAPTGEGRHRQRHRRTAFALVALLLGALLALLILSFLGHSPNKTPVALSRPHSGAPKQGALHTKPKTGLPAVVCVGQHKSVARSPTKKDFKRLKRNAAKVRKEAEAGKAPKMPSEITGRRLPNGTFSGTCLYGGQHPATVPPDSNY